MERRRVGITGLGAVTPIGLTVGESWQAVKNGVCGIGPITHYDPAAQKVKLAAEVKGFDPEALLGRQESKRMGRFTQFAVAAAREALSDAGFSVEQADPDRCGVILSSGIGGQAITEAEHSRGQEKGFDRAFEITSVQSSFTNLLRHLKKGGVIVQVGMPPKGTKFSVDLDKLIYSECEVRGVRHHTMNDMQMAAKIINSGVMNDVLQQLVSAVYPMEDCLSAFLRAGEDKTMLRVLLDFTV